MRDPWRKVFTLVAHCGTCGEPIYYTAANQKRRLAYNVTAEGEATIDRHLCTTTAQPKSDRTA